MSADDWRSASIGLGGNVGDVRNAMIAALRAIDASAHCIVTSVSSIYVTEPWGLRNQPDFLNACALVKTRLEPTAFLALLKEQEQVAGRTKTVRWGPRIVDLDILTFGGLDVQGPALTIPHARMLQRAFVLVPLAEIAPEMRVSGKRVSDWLSDVDTTVVTRSDLTLEWQVENLAD
ncbi:MAG: 2-amino-4-hydroxy-6-hydroxymethyldihydropteridine diphosphokinase [Pseudomonadota bacterium]